MNAYRIECLRRALADQKTKANTSAVLKIQAEADAIAAAYIERNITLLQKFEDAMYTYRNP